MRKDGIATREKILEASQQLMLDHGYAGMTVDLVLERVGITKGAFFHHFKSKDELARALLDRFAAYDLKIYQDTRDQAGRLSDDPLQRVLLFIRLFEDLFSGMSEPYPGCLFASYLYELQQFGDDTRQIIRDSFERWRTLLKEMFDDAARAYPPKSAVDTAVLADAFTVVLEGAFITAKAMHDPQVVVDQLRLFRNHVELLFGAAA